MRTAPVARTRELVTPALAFLTPAQAADLLGVPLATLAYWRAMGTGVPYYKLHNGRIRYVRSEVIAFIKAGRVVPSANASPK